MNYNQFVKQVQSVAQLNYSQEAERATRATLEVLREPMVGDEAKDLASQLPVELKDCLHGRECQNGQYFSLKEFYERAGEREGVNSTDAAIHPRAVFTVLQAEVTPGVEDIRANFSDDYQELYVACRR
ncbi:DUF2267 domain-containing protein [Funiculus sociatus GB2-A5]|uniref:DUF2267 domain-containing protein n=1 Tax=Funiculus sociatus GB2-A5 TaxID=2933946 RepID=A0ABV0JSL8_9CYAN|nr:DUF2267 domain-containing protein [Trichocoleus sp. FACHB-832]MBD2063651.1 DUF2267 domain-containing protein [Trichocoleus sp. FACHB-6]